MAGVVRKDLDSEDPASESKRVKTTTKCVKCSQNTLGSSSIACSKCSQWTHAKKACSDLSSTEAKRDVIINAFLCSKCVKGGQDEPIEVDPSDGDLSISGDLKSILTTIVNELRECKSDIQALIKENANLRRENGEIKSLLINFGKSPPILPNNAGGKLQLSKKSRRQNQLSPQQPPQSQRGRDEGRRRDNSSARDRSMSKRRSQSRDAKSRNNVKGRKSPSSVTNEGKHARTERKQAKHVRILGTTYSSDESKKQLLIALPINKAKFHMKTVFVTLYNSAASAKHVYERLQSRHSVSKVVRLKTKSKHDTYRCFSFQCCDLDYEALCEDEELFHPGTLIGEMEDEPSGEQALEVFPTS